MPWQPFGFEQFALEPGRLMRLLGRLAGELHFGVKVRSFYLSDALSGIDAREVSSALDAGCGLGQTSFWLRRRFPGAKVHGIDLNPAMVEHCRLLAKALGVGGATFAAGDISALPSSPRYDLIVCTDVLEHVASWKSALKSLVGALNPGGWLIVHAPHEGPFQSEQYGLRAALPEESWPDEAGAAHLHEGLDWDELDVLKEWGVRYTKTYTFGAALMWVHTVFECYRGRSRAWHLLLTPLLCCLARPMTRRRLEDGGGVLVLAQKL